MHTLKPDWYSEHPSNLPKADIAAYVRAETTIATPTIFSTLEDGLEHVEAGGSIILRSESPDQYEGPSGIFPSRIITPKSLSTATGYWQREGQGVDLTDYAIAKAAARGGVFDQDGQQFVPGLGILATAKEAGQSTTFARMLLEQRYSSLPNAYCRLNGMQIEEYIADNSYSVFEYIPGTNVTVIADSAIADRWHVYGANRATGASWRQVDADTMTMRDGVEDQLADEQVREIIAAYEEVRHLPRFNEDHCPIMEMQLGNDDKLYFLQYHRARDFAGANTELDPKDYPEEDGWLEAENVRGELPQQQLELTLHYPSNFDLQRKLPAYLKTEQASANMGNHRVVEEVAGRQRSLRVFPYGADALHGECADGHMSRSGWYKAQSGLVLPRGVFRNEVADEVYDELVRTVYRTWDKMASIAVEAVTDGNKGYLRIDRDSGEDGLITTQVL